ncbi:MAG: class I SAM-dependent methyltransferase [Defluviitaleaceae bacterium]|nr:class I SAM-dependent methyltransferase [Defluviitaleaceae bacterium]
MIISKRIQTIAGHIAFADIADIGTDHGHLPIFAIQSGLATRAIAADINPGPLSHARRNAASAGITDIDFRLGGGLDVLQPGEAGTIVISGMGGRLLADILRAGRDVAASAGQLILSPHLDVPYLRRAVHGLGFNIFAEDMTEDDGKYYNILDIRAGAPREADYGGREYLLGRHLLRTRPPAFLGYCRMMAARYAKIADDIRKAAPLGSAGTAKLAETERLRDAHNEV